jgi:hypothetical protein
MDAQARASETGLDSVVVWNTGGRYAIAKRNGLLGEERQGGSSTRSDAVDTATTTHA